MPASGSWALLAADRLPIGRPDAFQWQRVTNCSPVGAANRWAIGDPLPLGQSNAPLVLQRVLWVVQPHPAADVSHRHHRRVSLASECRRVLYKSSVTAYKRRMTVRYVVLQVISHSIQTSYDGKLCCSTVISHSIRTSRDGKVCCSIGHQSQHTNVAWR